MPASLSAFLLVGAGGAAGAMARYGLSLLSLRIGASAPVGTLAANLAGCLIMGVLLEMLSRTGAVATGFDEQRRLLVGVGFCGAFTTLSSFVVDASQMLGRGESVAAFGYIAFTLAGGFACFYGGALLYRAL